MENRYDIKETQNFQHFKGTDTNVWKYIDTGNKKLLSNEQFEFYIVNKLTRNETQADCQEKRMTGDSNFLFVQISVFYRMC